MITYEQRVAKMNKPGDEDTQLRLAKQYARKLHDKAKAGNTLEEKIALKKIAKRADAVMHKLRQNIFDLEDMLYKKAEQEKAEEKPKQQIKVNGEICDIDS
jgi:hypothetical protein